MGCDGTMLNPIFLKNVQGQKHPGRWEITERKLPNVKMLLKTNTNGHKNPSINLDTIGETKENNKLPHQHRNRPFKKNNPTDCDGVQLHQYWIALPVYVYIRPIRPITFLDRNNWSSGGNTSSNPQV